LEKVELESVLAYLNEKMLFQVQWGIRGRSKAAERSQAYTPTEARAKYLELVAHCENEGILQPRAVYGYWPANSDGDDLIIFAPPRGTIQRPEHHGPEIARFRFPRQQTHPYWCLADFWRPVSAGVPDLLAGTIVTAGPSVSEAAHRWLEEGKYEQYFLLHGLGVELAEALAEYLHKLVRVDLGVAGQDARERQKLFQKGYQGCRYSFGYPACPNLQDQEDLLRLLDSVRIGVSLTETCQLEPEQSTSAIITYHPKARYFSV
jgi:5-methyltetrahydrofolate--homocysteine methyltransferase